MKVKAYFLLLELSEQLRGVSHERHLVAENYGINSLGRNKTGKSSLTMKDLEFVQLRLDRLTRLTRPAAMFVVFNILEKLKKYNLLWYHPASRKSQQKIILKELLDKKLLFHTETNGIYIVNPTWMWRGTIFTCVEATKTMLRKEGRPTTEMIRDLKPDPEYMLTDAKDYFHIANQDEFHGNMLKEPEPPLYG